jgi:hypothetical protein
LPQRLGKTGCSKPNFPFTVGKTDSKNPFVIRLIQTNELINNTFTADLKNAHIVEDGLIIAITPIQIDFQIRDVMKDQGCCSNQKFTGLIRATNPFGDEIYIEY